MSGHLGVAPTRQNLLRAARRLDRVVRGTLLLRRKREALVGELFRLARPAADARARMTQRTRSAWSALLGALAVHGRDGLRALGWPSREIPVALRTASVWGIPVASIETPVRLERTLAERGTPPGTGGGAAARAAREFEQLGELLLAAAPREMLIRRLGEALSRTSRQVHTLERRVAPTLQHQMTVVRRHLEEREREEHLRLKHVVSRRTL